MGKWRDAFEEQLPPPDGREYGEEYIFGPPATDEQLRRTEAKLGIRLPDDLSDLLREFNGVRCTTKFSRASGRESKPLFLDTDEIAGIPDTHLMKDMLLDREEQMEDEGADPALAADLTRVAFFWQSNGFSDLYGLSSEPVAGFPAGAVVRVDHESSGSILEGFPDLLAFLRSARCK